MRVYEITIKPLSAFGTPLKGDSMFGHICWQAFYDESLFGRTADSLIANYDTNPFLIVSSAFPRFWENGEAFYALKRPDLPMNHLFCVNGKDGRAMIRERKDYKAKKWMLASVSQKIGSLKSVLYATDSELAHRMERLKSADAQEARRYKGGKKTSAARFMQSRNTINRLTGTTGEGAFAPFAVGQSVFHPQMEFALFIAISEGIFINSVEEALKRIGATGYGKDASTGLGRFEVLGSSEFDPTSLGATHPNACYTLSPCVPEKNTFRGMFYTPFIRFGRHGDVLAKSGNPFKNPVITADEGAVFEPALQEVFDKPYIGSAVKNISKVEPNTIMQGYALYIPVALEV